MPLALPRKLLIVERIPKGSGWNLMWEGADDSSHVHQLPDHLGRRILARLLDVIVDELVQSGLYEGVLNSRKHA